MLKRCLICEKPIETSDLGVLDATIWNSHGNYGSTICDFLQEGVFLEAFICDPCLVAKTDLIDEVVVRRHTEEVRRRPPEF